MDKKLLYMVACIVPISIFVFYGGLMVASRSFMMVRDSFYDDQLSIAQALDPDDEGAQKSSFLSKESLEEDLAYLVKGLLLKNKVLYGLQSKLVHTDQGSCSKGDQGEHLTDESKKTVILRPSRAHAQWKRLQKKPIFMWPVNPEQFWVSSLFGPGTLKGRKRFHNGIDLAAMPGTPVLAAANGKVLEARYASGYGNYIVLCHAHRFKTRYAHLQKIEVRGGQWVTAGQVIGRVGATGKVAKSKWGTTASHLHFEVYSNGKRVNPFYFLA